MNARIAARMIKRFLLIFLFLAQQVFAQVPNYSFENWTNSNPDSWQTANIAMFPASIIADSDSYDGYLSVKGIVVSTNNNQPYAPYLGISGGVSSGFHITDRYLSATGWCKLSLLQGDKFTGNVRIYNNIQEPIGEGSVTIDATSSGWMPFTMNITYFDSDAAETCSFYFTITDSTELMSGQIGSYFLLDNLSMTSTTGINENITIDNISVFPNPSHSELHINITDMKEDIFYSLVDITGREVLSNKVIGHNETVMLNDISTGIYFLNFYCDEKKFVKKIVVE